MSEPAPDTPVKLSDRFIQDSNQSRLIEVLAEQFLIRGDKELAKEVASISSLLEVDLDETLIEQDGCDDDIYLILSGSFSILVNGRSTGIRTTGMHVGEMALVDTTSRRSASVVASEPSLVAKVNSGDFEKVAESNPQIWRRLAIELSRRLKERNKFHPPPRSQPVIFLGSTVEGLSVAREIQSCFSHDPFVAKVWEKGIFTPGATPIEDLVKIASECDFGIVVVTPDDQVTTRGESHDAPRDNVIFELGLLIGAIGRNRTFIVSPRKVDLKIPTDLLGVTPLTYDDTKPSWQDTEIPIISNEIRKMVNQIGPI
jgi:CRP/FNR family transcriptional regulator, cyclic AMP receptor protein